MLDDTLSEGKVELKIDAIKSKTFVNESANINFRYSLKPDTLNLLLEDPSPVSTINKDNNFGPRVPFIFSRPITSADDYAFQLIADSDTVDLNVDWINPISFSFIPNNGWQEKTNYRINIFGNKLTPIEGKSFKDSITYVDVSSQKKIGYGALMGTLDEFPESMLIELKQTSDEAKSFFSNVNSNNEFYIKNLPEGKYQLIMIEDLDKNNVFTYGTIQPFKRSEWFYVHPDTFEVRANWDIDVGQISMEGN